METPNSSGIASWTIVIVDASKNRFSPLMKSMEDAKLKAEYISPNAPHYIERTLDLKPDIVMINLFLNGKSTLADIKELKKGLPGGPREPKIIVMSAHNSINNIREAVKAGADDFVLEPINPAIMIQRLRYQLQDREFFKTEDFKNPLPKAETPEDVSNAENNFQLLYDALRILSEITAPQEALSSVLVKVADLAKSNRVNLIEGDLESNEGFVAASSDDPNLSYLKIDLEKYPEVREVLLNGNIIYIKDVTQNPLTQDIQNQVKSIKITSLLVFPIRHRSLTLGSLNIRLAGELKITQRNLKTFYMIALALGPKLAARKLLRKHSLGQSVIDKKPESIPGVSGLPTSDHQE